ncbi:MAG: PAC2 family protein [Thermodesulfobacteriota bacterium]
MSELTFHARPVLKRPVLVMCLSGWSNAGEVSTGTHDYLATRLRPRPLADINPEPFFALTEERPTANIDGGLVQELHLPLGRFSFVSTPLGEPDLILFKGPEPNFFWKRYCDLVFELVAEMKVWAVFTLGGSFDYVPHWLPPEISAVYSGPEAYELMSPVRDEVLASNYQGPVSLHTMLLVRGREMGVPVVGLWGHAPLYIQTGNLKLHRALVEVLKTVLGLSLDTSDLTAGIAEMDRQIEDLVAKNPKLAKYIEDLKRDYQDRPEDRRKRDARRGGDGKGKIISLDAFLRRDEE